MNRIEITNEYFMWLCDLVDSRRFSGPICYDKLLMHLHNTEFVYLIPKDQNRAEDGLTLRYRFSTMYDHRDRARIMDYLEGPCSVLEMMVALAKRCEQTLMDDPLYGNRTGEWFWGMVTNLGLGAMFDDRFDKQLVHDTISRFLNREYEPNGRGGLFTVNHCDHDLRDVEIWNQLSYYLGTIT
jgi:hypothetical protein